MRRVHRLMSHHLYQQLNIHGTFQSVVQVRPMGGECVNGVEQFVQHCVELGRVVLTQTVLKGVPEGALDGGEEGAFGRRLGS